MKRRGFIALLAAAALSSAVSQPLRMRLAVLRACYRPADLDEAGDVMPGYSRQPNAVVQWGQADATGAVAFHIACTIRPTVLAVMPDGSPASVLSWTTTGAEVTPGAYWIAVENPLA
jgi:hypothetical protein